MNISTYICINYMVESTDSSIYTNACLHTYVYTSILCLYMYIYCVCSGDTDDVVGRVLGSGIWAILGSQAPSHLKSETSHTFKLCEQKKPLFEYLIPSNLFKHGDANCYLLQDALSLYFFSSKETVSTDLFVFVLGFFFFFLEQTSQWKCSHRTSGETAQKTKIEPKK